MSVTTDCLIEAGYAPSAETTGYTSTGVRTIIDKYVAYNSDTVVQTLTVKLVANAGSAGASNVILVKTMAPGETYTFPELVGNVLSAGDFLSELASAASKIVRRMSGRRVAS